MNGVNSLLKEQYSRTVDYDWIQFDSFGKVQGKYERVILFSASTISHSMGVLPAVTEGRRNDASFNLLERRKISTGQTITF